jgi:hypothetical protein
MVIEPVFARAVARVMVLLLPEIAMLSVQVAVVVIVVVMFALPLSVMVFVTPPVIPLTLSVPTLSVLEKVKLPVEVAITEVRGVSAGAVPTAPVKTRSPVPLERVST